MLASWLLNSLHYFLPSLHRWQAPKTPEKARTLRNAAAAEVHVHETSAANVFQEARTQAEAAGEVQAPRGHAPVLMSTECGIQ